MDDIRQWHIGVAILVAAAIHALSTGLYLSLLRPAPTPTLPPPLIVRLPPPASAPPAIRQELPAVAMPQPAPPPVPVPLPAPMPALPTIALPETEEPPPAVEPEPTPQPLDLTQFDLPEVAMVPVPRPKPAPPPVQAVPAPAPRPAAPPVAAPPVAAETSPQTARPVQRTATGRIIARWPRHVEELSPTQRRRLLEEHYIDNKANWQPWYESRDDAWRRLNMGFADPTAPYDIIDLMDPSNRDKRPPGWDINVGPITMQEAEAALKEMVAAGTKAIIGRDVKSINNLSFRERNVLLKERFGNDHRWMVGFVDPKAKKHYLEKEAESAIAEAIGMTQPPLTVQEIEETLDRLVALGTGHVIGRNAETADELNDGERDALLRKYYENDPRWERGVIDPTVPLDHLDPALIKPAGWDENEAALTIQEVEETLRNMLEQKLREQDAAGGRP
jgi:hypothetical protein